MKKHFLHLFFLLFLLLLLPACLRASAHPGRTDAQGGHYDRSTGEYHYHHGYPAHQHEGGTCPYDFDNKTGANSGSSSSGSKSSSDRETVPYTEPTTGMETTKPRGQKTPTAEENNTSSIRAIAQKEEKKISWPIVVFVIVSVATGTYWLIKKHKKVNQLRIEQEKERQRQQEIAEEEAQKRREEERKRREEELLQRRVKHYAREYQSYMKEERLFLMQIGLQETAAMSEFCVPSDEQAVQLLTAFLQAESVFDTQFYRFFIARRRAWFGIRKSAAKILNCPSDIEIEEDGSVVIKDCSYTRPYGVFTGYLVKENARHEARMHIKRGCKGAVLAVNMLTETRMICSVCGYHNTVPSMGWVEQLQHLLLIEKRYKTEITDTFDKSYLYKWSRYYAAPLKFICKRKEHLSIFDLVE